jgi:tetratricopeptide (TPR) repeat protein
MSKDSSDAELFSDLASLHSKMKNFDRSVEMYQRKIDVAKATTNDYYRMGQAYYQMQQFGKADTAFTKVTEIQPKLLVGYLWRARSNSSLDPDSKEGLAKPYYEEVVAKGEEDTTNTAKYVRELTEAYKYLGFYYYIKKDYPNARIYWEKVKAIDPNDKQALDALKDMKGK